MTTLEEKNEILFLKFQSNESDGSLSHGLPSQYLVFGKGRD